MLRRPTTSTLFPYTTLFRSLPLAGGWLQNQNTGTFCSCLAGKAVFGFKAWSNWIFRFLPPFAKNAKDRKSTRLNSSHPSISYAVFCLKKKKRTTKILHYYQL